MNYSWSKFGQTPKIAKIIIYFHKTIRATTVYMSAAGSILQWSDLLLCSQCMLCLARHVCLHIAEDKMLAAPASDSLEVWYAYQAGYSKALVVLLGLLNAAADTAIS